MHNDAKLGLLAGVAGVVVAAVLLSRNPPAAAPLSAASAQTGQAPAPAATPAKPGPVAKASAAAVPADSSRSALHGATASRSNADDDD